MAISSTLSYKGRLIAGTGSAQVVLDTFQDESIKVNNNILKISDIGEIPGTFTQQISLPGTKNNNDFFEQYYDISVYSPDVFNTNQVIEARLDFDGIFIADGFIKLDRVNLYQGKYVDSYLVTLYGSISDFAVNSRLYTLNDLDSLSQYNHTASLTAITSSWSNGLFSGSIVYPLAEYGQKMYYSANINLGIDEPSGSLAVQDFKPAIKVKKVWDAIFAKLGYTYTGSFWDEPHLDKMYMILNKEGKTLKFTNADIENLGQGKLIVGSTNSTYYNILLPSASVVLFPSDAEEYDYTNAFTPISSSYGLNFSSSLKGEINLRYSASFTPLSIPQFSVVFKTGSVQYETVLSSYNTILQNGSGYNVYNTYSVVRNDIVNFQTPVLPSGSYTVNVKSYPTYPGALFNVRLNPIASPAEASTFKVTQVQQAADNRIVDIPFNMPYNTNGIFLIDFIKGIQKKYNLIIYPSNTVAKQMIVETFDTWYKKGIRQDFNQYIDTSQKIEVSPLSLYKQITFKDTDDNDYASQQYNRVYNKGFGESQFYYSSSFFAGGDWNVETIFAGAPLIKIPNTYTSGSFLTNDCTTYTLINETEEDKIIRYTPCGYTGSVTPPYSDFATINVPANLGTVEVCSTGLFDLEGGVSILYVGDACSSGPIGSGSYYDVWVPGYIADAEYKPTTVSPRLLYYNGLVPCTTFYINGFINSSSIQNKANYAYPYFDYYLASSGSLPDVNSSSSLFNNELSAYDVIPNNNLVSDYWATYISLLYNPRTKMLKANGIIPFADYINIELNDVAQFRGNYYHVRAINNYNLSTGECEIELLGPIISDTLTAIQANEPIYNPCTFDFSVTPQIEPVISLTYSGSNNNSGLIYFTSSSLTIT